MPRSDESAQGAGHVSYETCGSWLVTAALRRTEVGDWMLSTTSHQRTESLTDTIDSPIYRLTDPSPIVRNL